LIQELVLILDGREGVVLAFILFGASEFGSRRSPPEGFQIDHAGRRSRQRVTGFVALIFGNSSGNFGGLRSAKNEPKWLRFVELRGVECMT